MTQLCCFCSGVQLAQRTIPPEIMVMVSWRRNSFWRGSWQRVLLRPSCRCRLVRLVCLPGRQLNNRKRVSPNQLPAAFLSFLWRTQAMGTLLSLLPYLVKQCRLIKGGSVFLDWQGTRCLSIAFQINSQVKNTYNLRMHSRQYKKKY